MEMEVNKTKIIIGINIVFIALIVMAFLPALKSGDEGYNTKTVDVMPDQEEIASTEVVATPDLPEVDDEAMVEESAPVITMVEDMVDEGAAAAESVVNETVSTIEDNVEEVKTEMTELVTEAVAPIVETITPASTPVAVEGLYSVVDGNKLDASSYAGFKLYRNWCARCHGTYGQGMVGPDLAESLKFISEEQFYDTVENGKSGTIGSMPAWKANVQVMENKDQLYAYLKARSDGAIGVEKPKKQ